MLSETKRGRTHSFHSPKSESWYLAKVEFHAEIITLGPGPEGYNTFQFHRDEVI